MDNAPARVHADGGRIRVEGVLTFGTVPAVLRASREWFASESNTLVFDLVGVEEADSAALALLMEWLRMAKRHGRALEFRNMPSRLVQLARISELDALIDRAA